MLKYLFLAVTLILSAQHVLGCKMSLPPLSFDTDHYVFTGEVVEIIENVKYNLDGNEADAVGLKIKVSNNIYSPKEAVYFEVFPFRSTPWCALKSDAERVREQFPVGSQVRVVAKEATILRKYSAESSIVQLQVSGRDRSSIARNDLSDELRTSAKTFYDYSSFRERSRTTPAEDVLVDSNHYLPEFELRKDLLRLKEAKSEDERTRILERLVFYSNANLPNIAQTYLKDQVKLVTLVEKWKEQRQKRLSKTQ